MRTARPFVLAAAILPAAVSAQSLTLDHVATPSRVTGSLPSAPQWSPDSKWFAFTWDSAGRGVRRVWIANRDGSGRRAIGSDAASARELLVDRSAQAVLALRGSALVRIAVRDGAEQRLAEVGDAESLVLSPDGTTIAFLRDGDLYTVPSTGGSARRLTTLAIAGPSTAGLGTYARRDREIGAATWATGAPSVAWHPDSRTLAVQIVDRTSVRKVPFPYYLGAETQPNELRRSYPGDVNEVRRVALVDVASGAMTDVPLPEPTERAIVQLAWSSRGVLLIDRETDDAIERTVHLVTREQPTAPRLVWRDRRESRIYNAIASTWNADGSALLLTGDLDDRYRVYSLVPGDSVPRPLTPATSDVDGAAVAAGSDVFYVSSAPRPSERHVWRVSGRGAPVQVTSRAGVHRPFVSPDGRTVATLVSDDVTPPGLYVVPATGGAEVAVVAGPLLEGFGLVRPEYVRFVGADAGDTLHAKVWLPAAARGGARVPVVFGPVYSNTVRNRWGGTYGLLQQHLVQRGYAVIQVDVRGSTGYGRAFREKFLVEWGRRDLDDLAATKRWLGSTAWADTARMGIFGSSYGGLITVYALFTRPGMFVAGVAGAAAVEPRFFGSDDVAITRKPSTHPEAFARGAIHAAGGLQDHLMLIHGLMDDVVPFKTTAMLAEELMRRGKDFDLVIAPGATHGWTARPAHARYLLGKLVQHFDRHLP
ncbi:MAG: prolyl oligopeptidase family serine peptidase, partial [Gemmatimonadaceae bacterium]|nr:prolyl oligopeptidase family serine peptidase [Gemmatimonadaceae bacterium]